MPIPKLELSIETYLKDENVIKDKLTVRQYTLNVVKELGFEPHELSGKDFEKMFDVSQDLYILMCKQTVDEFFNKDIIVNELDIINLLNSIHNNN